MRRPRRPVTPGAAPSRRVWDPLVRVLHWALVAAYAAAWATTVAFGGSHEAVGYAGLAIVAVRIAWGLVGPESARFASFVRSPRTTFAYLRRVVARSAPRHLGHNPLGAWMVVALCACMLGLACTGWLYRTDRFWGSEEVELAHSVLAWTSVVLVGLHVAGVVYTSLRHRENLVAAMWSGRKRAADGDDVDLPQRPTPR
jgi:cytochrome b